MWQAITYWAASIGHQTTSPSNEPSPCCKAQRRRVPRARADVGDGSVSDGSGREDGWETTSAFAIEALSAAPYFSSAIGEVRWSAPPTSQRIRDESSLPTSATSAQRHEARPCRTNSRDARTSAFRNDELKATGPVSWQPRKRMVRLRSRALPRQRS